jgi:hypothetical protein
VPPSTPSRTVRPARSTRVLKENQTRRRVPKRVQVQVFERDKWLCRCCLRPVIFPPVMRYLEIVARQGAITRPLAYYQRHWPRDEAPLLDELAACAGRVTAHVSGGSGDADNLATICARCHPRKGALTLEEHQRRCPLRKVKSVGRQPTRWDGLASVFIALFKAQPGTATSTERAWASELMKVWAINERPPRG